MEVECFPLERCRFSGVLWPASLAARVSTLRRPQGSPSFDAREWEEDPPPRGCFLCRSRAQRIQEQQRAAAAAREEMDRQVALELQQAGLPPLQPRAELRTHKVAGVLWTARGRFRARGPVRSASRRRRRRFLSARVRAGANPVQEAEEAEGFEALQVAYAAEAAEARAAEEAGDAGPLGLQRALRDAEAGLKGFGDGVARGLGETGDALRSWAAASVEWWQPRKEPKLPPKPTW